jgi:hypothetical protein
VKKQSLQITIAAFLGVFSALVIAPGALAQTTTLITTFTNPSPAFNERFGGSIAALGSDRVIIAANWAGASNQGEAYLFSTNGTLLTTFTNPTPELNDYFGMSVAAVGNDRVLIGAPYDTTGAPGAGAAYLFSTNAALLMTFTNPVPGTNDLFGVSVAAVGGARVLIGASLDDTSAPDSGAAYLFSVTNGALLATFTNPPPVFGGNNFGQAVAALGSDRVLIGALGTVHLFSTNGALLNSFNNPSPSFNNFGYPVASLGSDHVLIGAIFDRAGASDAGAAYLFNANGALITTFTNPTPAVSDYFGNSVASLGGDRLLIGAVFENTGATDAGAAYLFSTNGTLLATITNPAPAVASYFGRSLAVVGGDRVLIGADGDDTGDLDAGAAYLFSLPPAAAPSLRILTTSTNTLILFWPSPSTGFVLQQNTNLITTNWVASTNAVNDNGDIKYATVNSTSGNRFYRLFKP